MLRKVRLVFMIVGSVILGLLGTGINTDAATTNGIGDIAVNAEETEMQKWGDCNGDGDVGIADAVLILQSLANPDKYKLSSDSADWADVYQNGDGITASDALSIQRYIAKVITELPESYSEGRILSETTINQTATATTTRETVNATTTTKITTASETTTNTTTANSTVIVTATSNTWTPPQKEALVHDGEQIDDDTYNILLNTAEMFGIDQYEIVWSDHPIQYAYTDPGSFYCMKNGFAYGYGVQIASGEDIETLCPDMKKLAKYSYKQYDYLCYRPLVEDDNLENVLESYECAEGADKSDTLITGVIVDLEEPEGFEKGTEGYLEMLEATNYYNSFKYINWYLVPTSNNEQILELNYPNDKYNTLIGPAANTRYWFTNEELYCGAISRLGLEMCIYTAEQFNFSDFKIVYNSSKTEPIYYSFQGPGVSAQMRGRKVEGAVQIVKTEDIISLLNNLEEICLQMADGDEDIAKYYYNNCLDTEKNPVYYWTYTKNVDTVIAYSNEIVAVYNYLPSDTYDGYVMIPLDENGNEILKLMYDNTSE